MQTTDVKTWLISHANQGRTEYDGMENDNPIRAGTLTASE